MRWFSIIVLLCAALALVPAPAPAQDEDGTFLSRLLEEQLSDGAARQVNIEGFRGAFSSEAELARLTISDADGPWLILEDATLIWTRSALLSGSLEIQELSAARLELIRPPSASDGPDLPTAEAQPFSLPNLPVRVEIEQVSVADLVLGESILGVAARLSVEGSARLADGAAETNIALVRLDGPEGSFDLDASYTNADGILSLDLRLNEAEGGLAAELLGLPGRPDLRLSVAGTGPLDAFETDISLATEGEDRIVGQVQTQSDPGGEIRLSADIGGDIRPLLQPEYRAFFGDDVRLQTNILRQADGSTDLERLHLNSAALDLEGALALDPGGLPTRIDLQGAIRPAQGSDVRLPVPNAEAEIASATLSLGYDRAAGDQIRLTLDLNGLHAEDARIASAALTLDGRLALTEAGFEAASGTITAGLRGIDHVDRGLAQAIGPSADLSADLSWVDGAPFILSNLVLTAGDVEARGGFSAMGGDARLDVAVDLSASAGDLNRFSSVAGQPLRGEAELGIVGQIEALSGALALDIRGQTRDVTLADTLPTGLFASATDFSARLHRDATGVRLESVSLQNQELSLSGQAELSSGRSEARLQIDLRDAAIATDVLSGPVSVRAQSSRLGTEPFDLDATLSGPNEIEVAIGGHFDLESSDFALSLDASAQDLDLGFNLPPQLLAGRISLAAEARRSEGVLAIRDLDLRGAAVSVTGSGQFGPQESRVEVTARLADVGLFTDVIRGPATAEAILNRRADAPWQVAANLGGPGNLRADVAGAVGLSDGQVDLTINGQAPLGIANRFIAPRSVSGLLNFDLAMRGDPSFGALSGRLTTNSARVSLPTFALALENVGLSADLSGGQMRVDGGGALSTGGQLSVGGAINLNSPDLEGQIDLSLANGRVIDPTLYDARIALASLSVTGPLARAPQVSGQITLGESEIRVPEASLAGSAAIPDILYIGETPEARRTRGFAGLLGRGSSTANGAGGGSARTGLDITVTAPGRIFLRGRGIDAEFGGSVRLFGTSANVIPTGQFDLIRGRLSILGTRLDFVEGQATLQGSFDPFLQLEATTRTPGYQISIRVAGPASNPEITFFSDPALPEDEVLAQLLFGRSVSGLSPLQLLQLADAATSLAGGASNVGFVAELRDGLGLDDLDLSTDEAGNAAVTAGRYLSENVYTDVTINAQGEADLSLNIDLTPSITARGSVGSDGGSSVGVFFERDY